MSKGNERTVVLGLMSYIDENGNHRTAYKGDVVLVLPAKLERFDRLNVLMKGPDAAPEPVVVEPEPEAYPEGEPSDTWKVTELQAYAKAKGIDLGEATKKADILAAITAASRPGEPTEG
ncbi:hypothetical protein ACFVMC_00340 [Nocardia sp. NPDC127579]|uniref:hypothetical protein n=1 Tax=Nocardia sp. NPDC127579 TaxID=3345402 RepID=UPI00362E6593